MPHVLLVIKRRNSVVVDGIVLRVVKLNHIIYQPRAKKYSNPLRYNIYIKKTCFVW